MMGQVNCYFEGLKDHINLEGAVIKYNAGWNEVSIF
jgi:hypothetical protein